jgi:hypothetical protein
MKFIFDIMNQYLCKNCNWQGNETELEYETVEGCFGDDKIEVCPTCGSMNVLLNLKSETGTI